ncbi:MAG: hypothetical protein AAFV80_15910, partial [Bacteroidota bacterium]
ELVYKNGNPGTSTTISDNNGVTYTAFRQAPPGTSSNVSYYRFAVPGAGVTSITFSDESAEANLQSMVTYVFRQGEGLNLSSSGVFISQSLFQDSYTFTMTIPTGFEPRDIALEVPISELTNDGRVATISASADGITDFVAVYGADTNLGECCLDIVDLLLEDVPATTTEISVTVASESYLGVNPQSLVLAGVAQAAVQCGCINVDGAGDIQADESGCAPYDPAEITSVSSASGGIGGTVEYQWESSTDGTNYSEIGGATSENYDPGSISQTTYYRRKARRTTCTDYVLSNVVVKEAIQNFTSGGSIGDDEDRCESYDPALISNTSGPSGGEGGSTEYRWQYRNGTSGSWIVISGASSATYDPPTISSTRQYRRSARRTPCTDWVTSNNVTKTVNPQVSVTASGTATICNGESTDISASAFGGTSPYTYSWSNSLGSGASQTVSPSSTTTYTVTVTDNAGCTDVDQVTITVTALPVATINADASGNVCTDETITYTATNAGAGATYSWSFGTDATPSTASGIGPHTVNYATSSASSSNTITLTVTQSGCTNTDSETITVSTLPTGAITSAVGSDPSTCGGSDGSISVTATPPAGACLEFSIDGTNWVESNTPVFNNLPEGTYVVRGRYCNNNCERIYGSVTLSDPADPLAEINSNASGNVCTDETVTYTATDAGAGATYSWSFGADATPSTATGIGPHAVDYSTSSASSSNTITLTVTRFNCVSTDSEIITVSTLPIGAITSAVGSDPTTCGGADGSISVTATPPAGACLEFSIDGTNWVESNAPVFNNLPEGTYVVRGRYCDNNCERIYGSVTLNDPADPLAEMTISSTTDCEGDDVVFTATGAGSGAAYAWNFGANATPSIATGIGPHTVTFALSGNTDEVFDVTLSVTQNACVATSTEQVNIRKEPTIESVTSAGPTTCSGDDGSITVNISHPSGSNDGFAIGEVGSISTNQTGADQWHTVNLTGSYANPIVVMESISNNDSEPTTVRVRNIGTNSFEFQIDNWDYLADQSHGTETLGYLVMEAGNHILPDGTKIEAG